MRSSDYFFVILCFASHPYEEIVLSLLRQCLQDTCPWDNEKLQSLVLSIKNFTSTELLSWSQDERERVI